MINKLPLDDLNLIVSDLQSDMDKLKNATFFISGVTGFIGKCLLESLLWLNRKNRLNLRIYSISRNPEGFFLKNKHLRNYPEFIIYQHDLVNPIIISEIDRIDYVIHAATDVSNVSGHIKLLLECVTGTFNILQFSKEKKCKDFLLLSSGAVYGPMPIGITAFDETYIGGVDLLIPKSSYGLGKQSAEWLVQQYGDSMNIKIARCFAFVGPYLPLGAHFAIGNFIKNALNNSPIEIWGDGSAIRSYLYTTDMVSLLIKILLKESSGSVWNVGSDLEISILELAKLVKATLNPDLEIRILGTPSGRVDKYIPNISKIKNDFKYASKINLADAIQRTANWNLLNDNLK